MENAAEALKMAAAILVFVVALGISISSFSEARQTSDILVTYNDREYVTQYLDSAENKTRIVGLETIIPTIYRAYKENFKIYFYTGEGKSEDEKLVLYTKDGENINYIDAEEETWANDAAKDLFIMALLYGENAIDKQERYSDQVVADFKNNLEMQRNKLEW